MIETLHFGVFRLGQIWSVVQPDGRGLGFADRRLAVRTAHGLAAAAVKAGGAATIVIQDELGKLTTVAPLELVPAPTAPSDLGELALSTEEPARMSAQAATAPGHGSPGLSRT